MSAAVTLRLAVSTMSPPKKKDPGTQSGDLPLEKVFGPPGGHATPPSDFTFSFTMLRLSPESGSKRYVLMNIAPEA